MSKSEILYVKGMNISESEEEELAAEDIWDDRKLNDAYDKALRIANAEVAKRVAMSTNTQSDKDSSDKNKLKNKSSRGSSSKHSRKQEQWKVGMPCRAVYEGDGLEYEALVLRIINDKECVVRFLGYDNSEIVSISTLKPTLGKGAQASQIEQALIDKADDGFASESPNIERMEFGSDRVPSRGSTERSFQKKKKSTKKKKNQTQMPFNGFDLPEMPLPMPNPSFMKNLGSMEIPMPPPPLMFPASNRVESEDQAVSSMLLSWYMSGYYTGLYQGLRRAKEGRRN